jgi:phosphoribosylanthranilate isomerase
MNPTRNPAGALLPDFITFTGADDATDPSDLVALAEDYPVEFGLLISPGRQGYDPRYPTLETIEWLISELPLTFALHLCGGAAREVLAQGRSSHEDLLNRVDRVQINTADHGVDLYSIGRWAARCNVRAILQARGEFPKIAPVDVLFDASGGRGIVPADWPYAVKSTFCGYAGGLRPENVADAVNVIGFRTGQRYWLDMESGVRDEQNRFSVKKCREVCEAVYGAPFGGDHG